VKLQFGGTTMQKMIVVLAVMLLVATGCAYTFTQLPEQVVSEGQRVLIEQQHGAATEGLIQSVTRDTIRFTVQGESWAIPRSQVSAVYVPKFTRQPGAGMVTGAIAGLPLGWGFGRSVCNRRSDGCSRSDLDVFRGVGATLAVIVGAGIGKFSDPTDESWKQIPWPAR
jgi:hypothetical protein